MAGDEELFEDDAKPDEIEYEGYTGNAGPTLMYWYYKAVVVIWPKKLTLSITCKVGCDGVLDILECQATEKDPDVVRMLHDVLTYWESNNSRPVSMGFYWSDSVTSRLLELCLQVGGLEGFLPVHKTIFRRCQSLILVLMYSSEGLWLKVLGLLEKGQQPI